MRLYISFILIFIGCCKSTIGQQLFIQHYPTELHKASFQNWDIEQDHQGILYFANSYGILIFDGTHWERVELPGDAYCWSLACDQNGIIYVGGDHEFGYIEKQSGGSFRYISLAALLNEKERSLVKDIGDIVVLGDSIFFRDGTHCYIYRDGKINILNAPDKWFIPVGRSMYVLDDKTYTIFLYKNNAFIKQNLKVEGDEIRLIQGYKDKYLMILDQSNRLLIIDPASSSQKMEILSEGINATLKDLFISRIHQLTDDRFAFLTDREILITDMNGKILNRVTSAMLGESNVWPTIFYEDSRHNLWFATDEFIGMIVTSSPIAYYDKTNGFKGVVFALGVQGEERYIGTDVGLYRQKKNGQFEMIPGTNGTVWNIYSFKDRSYIAHLNGVFEVNKQRATKLVSDMEVMSLCVLEQHPECIVMGTFDLGIWMLKKNTDSWKRHKIKDFKEETRYIQEDSKGNLWISHDQKGIWKLRLNETMDSIIEKKIYTVSSGLPFTNGNRVFKLSDQKIIAGTKQGIYYYNETKDIFEADQRFPQELHEISSIAESPAGQIYFREMNADGETMVSGVLTRKSDSTYAALYTPFNKITWADSGIPLTATQSGAWFGNNNKVIEYNPTQRTFYEDPLQPIINTVSMGDSTIYVDSLIQGTMVIPYSKNNVSFDFTVIYFEDAEKNEFQYKLTGLSEEWSSWASIREANFTNLPEGNYTFEVRARNVYHNKSQIASFSFQITPPIYRTVWAYMVYVLLFIATVYGLTILRMKRVNKQKKVLQQEVYKKTKELMAMNEEILLQSETLEQQAEILKASNYTKDKLFSIISHDLRGPIRQFCEVFNMIERGYISVEEFQHKLMPDLKERANYVATLTDNLLQWAKGQMGGIQVNKSVFDISSIIHENINLLNPQAIKKSITLKAEIAEGYQCVYADQDMIKLIVRNFISNAIKFTPEMGTIEVSTKIESDTVLVSVRDNGTGIPDGDIDKILRKEYFTKYGTSGEKGSGLGLMLCREFIEKNNGVFYIKSKQGTGSIFSFRLDIYRY